MPEPTPAQIEANREMDRALQRADSPEAQGGTLRETRRAADRLFGRPMTRPAVGSTRGSGRETRR